jgi:O-antigen ligase
MRRFASSAPRSSAADGFGRFRRRTVGVLDGLETFGLGVLLAGLAVSEAAKSAGIALAVAAFVAKAVVARRVAIPRTGAMAALAFYFAAVCLSFAVAAPGYRSPHELLMIAMMIVAFPLVSDVCASRPSRRLVLANMVVLGAALGALGGYADYMSGSFLRLALPSIENAIPAGEYLAAASAFALPLLFAEAQSPIAGPLLGFATGASVMALLMTKSRGPLIGAGAGWLLSGLLGLRRRRLVALAAAAAVALVVLFALANPGARVVKDGVVATRSAENRVKTWRRTVELIRERPIVGHGPGTYKLLRVVFRDEVGVEWERNAHNVVLHTATEVGLLGAGALVLFLVLSLRDVVRGVRRARWPLRRAISVGALGAAAAIVVSGAFSVSTDAEPGILLFAVLALGAAAPGEQEKGGSGA